MCATAACAGTGGREDVAAASPAGPARPAPPLPLRRGSAAASAWGRGGAGVPLSFPGVRRCRVSAGVGGQLLPGLRCATCRFLPLFLVRAFLKGFSDRASLPGRGKFGRRFPGLAVRCGRATGVGSAGGGSVPCRCSGWRWLEAPGSPRRPSSAWRGQERQNAAGWLVASRGEGLTWPVAVVGVTGRCEHCVTAPILLKTTFCGEDKVLICCSPARKPSV